MIFPAGTIKRVHIDRRIMWSNAKHGTNKPYWTIQTSKGPIKCRKWNVTGTMGGDQSLPQLGCGARAYCVTRSEIEYWK